MSGTFQLRMRGKFGTNTYAHGRYPTREKAEAAGERKISEDNGVYFSGFEVVEAKQTPHARIAELERQLESARSLAIDRDQRLAELDAMLDEPIETFGRVPRGEDFRKMRRLCRGEEENA